MGCPAQKSEIGKAMKLGIIHGGLSCKNAMQEPFFAAGSFPKQPYLRACSIERDEVITLYVEIIPPAGFKTLGSIQQCEGRIQLRQIFACAQRNRMGQQPQRAMQITTAIACAARQWEDAGARLRAAIESQGFSVLEAQGGDPPTFRAQRAGKTTVAATPPRSRIRKPSSRSHSRTRDHLEEHLHDPVPTRSDIHETQRIPRLR